MKIKCEAYQCEFSDHNTCVRRQMKIKEWTANKKGKTKAGNYELLNAMPPEFFGMRHYLGCVVGTRLYKEAKKNGGLPVAVKKKKNPKMLESIRQINEYKSWTAARGW